MEEKAAMVVSALSVAVGEPYPCQGPGLNDPEACPHKAQLQWGGIGNKALRCTDCRAKTNHYDPHLVSSPFQWRPLRSA